MMKNAVQRILVLAASGVFVLVAVLSLALSRAGAAPQQASPGQQVVPVSLFWGKGCPHCETEKQFLSSLRRKHPGLKLAEYEVWYDKQNAALFQRVLRSAGMQSSAVPATVVGRQLFLGFNELTGASIERAIRICMEQGGCIDAVQALAAAPVEMAPQDQGPVPLPFFGSVDTRKLSLPVFTVVIGLFDSFNPCAFFVLLFLLSLLIHARSRAKMLVIGAVFVFFSAFIYFLFMAAWLNVFLIVGQLTAITVAAGLVALTAAAINIKDFFFFKRGLSLSIPEMAKPRLFGRMRGLLNAPTTGAMAAAAVVLAISANAYELLCTAGFPMLYTRVLTLHALPKLQYYLYLVVYNLVYVIPLAVMVIIVTVTLGAKKLTEWQGRRLKLVSGVMMFLLGLTLLVNPAFLNNILASVLLLVSAVILSGGIILVTKRVKPEIMRG